jgi:hypothetical protein
MVQHLIIITIVIRTTRKLKHLRLGVIKSNDRSKKDFRIFYVTFSGKMQIHY